MKRATPDNDDAVRAVIDDAAVDDLARARARALLDRVKGGRRG